MNDSQRTRAVKSLKITAVDFFFFFFFFFLESQKHFNPAVFLSDFIVFLHFLGTKISKNIVYFWPYCKKC